jgi:hypothetical protein
MRREAITLVTAMALSSILMTACDKPGSPDSSKNPPSSTTPPASPSSTTPPASPPATPGGGAMDQKK